MYCIQCGVRLGDSEKKCPLCGTLVFHPQLEQPQGRRLYPEGEEELAQVRPWALLTILSSMFLLPMLVTVLCDYQINHRISWSGIVVGALLLGYLVFVFPFWFRKPNPVIFVPVSFAGVGLYLLYLNLATGGDWFLSFAFPVVGGFGLITTAMVTLLRYIRRGRFYVLGGTAIAVGVFIPVMELLLSITFPAVSFVGWSWYSMIGLVVFGGVLLTVAISRPVRESFKKRFFI